MEKTLTVIIPAYNEEESLKVFLPEVIQHCKKNKYSLIVVNDGSMDASKDILNQHLKNTPIMRVITNKLNKGYGGALKEGVKVASTDYLITIDADGQHFLKDIDLLFSEIIKTDADMIIGSRKSKTSASLMRGIGKYIIRFIAKLLMKIPVYDINSGMKIYRTPLAKEYLKFIPDSMSFSDIITLTFINNRHLVIERPIDIRARLKGKSTIGVRTAFETVMEIINIIILFNPLKIFLPISLIFLFFGLFWGIYFFYLDKGISIGGSTLILAGIIIFLLGLIAEQLSALRKNK